MRVRGKSRVDREGWAHPTNALAVPARARSGKRCVRLILVEAGSAGLAAYAASEGSEQTVALVQSEDERAGEFATRVIRRIGTLEQSQHIVERAVLLLGPCFEAENTSARLLIARALLTHSAIAPDRSSELLLSATSGQRNAVQRWLPRWVDALMGQPGSMVMTIVVTFCDLLPSSSMADAPC